MISPRGVLRDQPQFNRSAILREGIARIRCSNRASSRATHVASATRRECHIDKATRGAAGERRKLIAPVLDASFRGAVAV